MTTEQKRAAVAAVYPDSVTWAHRVAHMSEDQVIAIYLRFKEEGKIQ